MCFWPRSPGCAGLFRLRYELVRRGRGAHGGIRAESFRASVRPVRGPDVGPLSGTVVAVAMSNRQATARISREHRLEPGDDGERSGDDGERSGDDGERSGGDGARSGDDEDRQVMTGTGR